MAFAGQPQRTSPASHGTVAAPFGYHRGHRLCDGRHPVLNFYYGLLHLAATDLAPATQYVGLAVYATLALSLPVVCGLFIAVVRARPDSAAGRTFDAARRNSARVALWGGLAVAVFLVIMGGVSLL